MKWNEFLAECKTCWNTEGQQGDKAVNAALSNPDTRDKVVAMYGIKYTPMQYYSEAYKTYKNSLV